MASNNPWDFSIPDPVSAQMGQSSPGGNPWNFNMSNAPAPMSQSVLPMQGLGGGGFAATPGMTPAAPSFMDSLKSFGKGAIGDKDSAGWMGPMATAGAGLVNAYTGYQQLQLGKDELSQNKREFELNFGNQRQSYNTQIEDRQRARLSADSGGYESLSTYLDKNRV
jgi:hypothetical protein